MNKLEEGMQKLMGYVEEMREEGINVCRPQFQQFDLLEMMLISKQYPLVKRLIDNDKIDRDKVLISFNMSESDGLGNYYGHGVEAYQGILMLLAISDTPIDDLISYLK